MHFFNVGVVCGGRREGEGVSLLQSMTGPHIGKPFLDFTRQAVLYNSCNTHIVIAHVLYQKCI